MIKMFNIESLLEQTSLRIYTFNTQKIWWDTNYIKGKELSDYINSNDLRLTIFAMEPLYIWQGSDGIFYSYRLRDISVRGEQIIGYVNDGLTIDDIIRISLL